MIANVARLPGVLGDHVNTLRRRVANFDGHGDDAIELKGESFGTQPADMRDQAVRLLARLEQFAASYNLPKPADTLEQSGINGPLPG